MSSELLLHVVIPGRPHPLQRARLGKYSTYDTEANRAAKDRIQWMTRWKQAPYVRPVSILIHCSFTKGNSGPVGYAAIKDGRYTTSTAGSKGSLQGPIVAYLSGGPAPDPKVEFPQMWFIDYRTTLTLEPKWGTTTFDVDVPKDTPRPK